MSNTKIYNFIFKHNYNTNYHRNCLILYLDKKKSKKNIMLNFLLTSMYLYRSSN